MTRERIRELALDNAATELNILLEETKELKRSLSLELDYARDRRLAQEQEFRNFMNELWGTLRKIQAQFRIDAQLLNLVGKENAGDQEDHQEERQGTRRAQTQTGRIPSYRK